MSIEPGVQGGGIDAVCKESGPSKKKRLRQAAAHLRQAPLVWLLYRCCLMYERLGNILLP